MQVKQFVRGCQRKIKVFSSSVFFMFDFKKQTYLVKN